MWKRQSMLISLANLTFPMTSNIEKHRLSKWVCVSIPLTAKVIWRLSHYKLEEMKINFAHLRISGLSSTLGWHLLIELSRIQTYPKLCIYRVWFWHMKEQRLNQDWIVNPILTVMLRNTNCQCYQSAMDISGAFIPINLSSATPQTLLIFYL